MKSKKGPFKMKKPSALKFFGVGSRFMPAVSMSMPQNQIDKRRLKGLPGYGNRKGNQKSHIKRKGLGNRILRALGL